jgi:hypothetical protein
MLLQQQLLQRRRRQSFFLLAPRARALRDAYSEFAPCVSWLRLLQHYHGGSPNKLKKGNFQKEAWMRRVFFSWLPCTR